MIFAQRSPFDGAGAGLATLLIAWAFLLILSPNPTMAQNGNNGLNAVWQSSSKIASPAFIDAVAYTSQGDICANLHYLISTAPTNGEVIDARGVTPANGTTQQCAHNPWTGLPNPQPTTILLPAGNDHHLRHVDNPCADQDYRRGTRSRWHARNYSPSRYSVAVQR
jgi:hypothetical protein